MTQVANSLLADVAMYANNAVILMDYNGNIEWINRAFTQMYGFTFEQLIQERGQSIFGRHTDPAVKVAFGKCIVLKQTIRFESQNVKRDGEKLWVSTTITPIIENGRVVQLIIIDSDISVAKAAEEKVKIQTKELERLAKQIQEQNTELAEVNVQMEERQEQIEQQSEELHAQADYLQYANDKMEQQKSVLEKSFGKLQRAEQQLLQSEKMASLGQLTAGIAHEINNPVNYIKAGIESFRPMVDDFKQILKLYEEVTPDNVNEKLAQIRELKEEIEYDELFDSMGELVASIRTGANRTAEIVKGLRTFSRLDEDDLKLADLHENIDSTLIMLRNQYKDRVEIHKQYASDIPRIECYPGKLNQVFMNILVNAIHAIENKGSITIATAKKVIDQTDWVQIQITDTGKGIPDEVKPRIFEPFFTTKPSGKGTGLGMSITLDIIKKHSGTIRFESEVGKGTTFYIEVPVRNPQGNDNK